MFIELFIWGAAVAHLHAPHVQRLCLMLLFNTGKDTYKDL